MELTNNTQTNVNYAGIFAKAKANNTLDYAQFFTQYAYDAEEVNKIKKEIKRLTDLLAERNGECAVVMNKRYNQGFTPLTKKCYFSYTNKNSEKFLFDIESGAPINEEDIEGDYDTINLGRKTGEVKVTVGYALELGAVVVRAYKFSIPSNNARIILTFVSETLVPVVDRFADKVINYADGTTMTQCAGGHYDDTLSDKIDAGDFLCSFYNIEHRYLGFSLKQAYGYYYDHRSMETLIRQVKDNDDLNMLLSMDDTEYKKSVAEYIGVTKNEFKILNEKHIIKDYLNLKKLLDKCQTNEAYTAKLASKTVPEWIDMIEKAKNWEEDMAFYKIGIQEDGLLCQLVRGYTGTTCGWYSHDFKDYYKYYAFGDYCAYIVDGVINQGYKSVRDFLNMQADYFKMCKELGAEPNPFSGYLSQLHDITSRNYSIHLDEIQEKKFVEAYKDFKPWVSKDKKYTMIAPKNANDIKAEGNAQSSCVGSYCKRVIDGACHIFFFRAMAHVEESFITIEVRDKKMVQVKRSHNRPFTDADKAYLLECCKAKGWEFDA